jgi:hypothetical protein
VVQVTAYQKHPTPAVTLQKVHRMKRYAGRYPLVYKCSHSSLDDGGMVSYISGCDRAATHPHNQEASLEVSWQRMYHLVLTEGT